MNLAFDTQQFFRADGLGIAQGATQAEQELFVELCPREEDSLEAGPARGEGDASHERKPAQNHPPQRRARPIHVVRHDDEDRGSQATRSTVHGRQVGRHRVNRS